MQIVKDVSWAEMRDVGDLIYLCVHSKEILLAFYVCVRESVRERASVSLTQL